MDHSQEPPPRAFSVEERATRASIADYIRRGVLWLRGNPAAEALVGCTATAMESLANQIEDGNDLDGQSRYALPAEVIADMRKAAEEMD
jgi:hypothetical protein